MSNSKKTSDDIASLASQILRDPKASDIQKKLAGSALSQKDASKQTGAEMEQVAAKALDSDKYNDVTKTLAGSVLSQSSKDR